MSTNTILFKAILAGNIDEVKTLLDNAKDIDINYFNKSSQLSFLDAACQTQNPDMINMLLDYAYHCARPPTEFWYNRALGIAMDDENILAVNVLLNSHKCTYRQAELFNLAALIDYLELIKALINYGLDYNATLPQPVLSLSDAIDYESLSLSSYATALYIACDKGNLAIVEYLLSQKDIDVNKGCPADVDGLHFISPLMIAVQNNYTEIVRLLLGNDKINVNQLDEQGNTPLDVAIKNNHTEVRDLLLAKNANVTLKQSQSQFESSSSSSSSSSSIYRAPKISRSSLFQPQQPDTPEQRFITAIENDELDDVKNYLDADQTIMNRCDVSPLNIACQEDHYEIAQLLIHYGADVNKADRQGHTPLSETCKRGHLQLLELLIDHGANTSEELIRPYMWMNEHPFWNAWLAGHVEIVNYLLQQKAMVMNEPALVSSILLCPKEHRVAMLKVLQSHGINLNISFPIFDVHKHDYPSSYYVSHTFQLPEPRQTSLLTEACLDGEPDLVEWLMSLEEIDVNLLDSIRHPLVAACYKGFVDTVEKLLTRDCGSAGRDALIIACDRGHEDIVDRLLASNLDVTTTGKITTSTPLIAACKRGHLGIVDRLIMQFGPNDELRGCSALMVSIIEYRIDIANRLIDSGVNVNHTDNIGRTALIHAIHGNQPAVVEKLINANADMLITDENGRTALDLAQILPRRREEIIALLEAALAKKEGIDAPRASMG